MRGVFTAQYDIVGLAGPKTLLYITAPATAVIEILSVHIADYNNAVAEQWEVSLHRVSSLGSPTATTITPQKHEAGDQAAASTVKANVTASEPTYDTNGPLDKQGVSNLAGYHYDPIPEERPIIAPSGTFGVRLLTTPTTTNVGVYVVFREIG